jgi:hypothetical protein
VLRESCVPKVTFLQAIGLNHRSHAAIKNDVSLFQKFGKRLIGIKLSHKNEAIMPELRGSIARGDIATRNTPASTRAT